MPSELEIAVAEKAAQEVTSKAGFSVRAIVKAALEAAEHVRFSRDIEQHMPTGQQSQQ